MKELIYHGIPEQNYFLIAVPPSWLHKSMDEEGSCFVMQDPKTNVKTNVQLMAIWTDSVPDFVKHWGIKANLIYSMDAAATAKVLKLKYPEINETNILRIALLKKL